MRPQLVIGRWRLVEVEYLPSDDDGGFADEGEGDVMSACALGLDDGFLEFAGDGTFRGQYWGPEEGTWRIDGGKVVLERAHYAPLRLTVRGDSLWRPDEDEEHGREMEIFYEKQ